MIAPHQKEFADTARAHEGCWHGTGTGKTRTVLYSLREHDGSILVIAPKTTVQKEQWLYEASVLGMKPPTVISKEEFRRDHKTIITKFDAVIVDEAHYVFGVSSNVRYRNKQPIPKASQLFEALEWYITTHKPKRFILATATPNKTPMSIWAAAKLLGYDWSFYSFRDQFYVRLPMDQIVYAPKRDKATIDRLAELTRSIGQVLRLADIKDVPEQTFITQTFKCTATQHDAIKYLPNQFTDRSALRLKRHQVENGLLYEDVFNPVDKKITRKVVRFESPKIDYIVDCSYEFPKMVIFANYTEQVDMIEEALKKEGKNVYVLDSRTIDRKAILNHVENAESAYLVCQASMSSEWEFKSCAVMVFASLSNKNLDYIQSLGRIQRYDAVKKNLYIHLVVDGKESVDNRWFNVIMSGKDFNTALYEKERS